jgi:hypothetical protein
MELMVASMEEEVEEAASPPLLTSIRAVEEMAATAVEAAVVGGKQQEAPRQVGELEAPEDLEEEEEAPAIPAQVPSTELLEVLEEGEEAALAPAPREGLPSSADGEERAAQEPQELWEEAAAEPALAERFSLPLPEVRRPVSPSSILKARLFQDAQQQVEQEEPLVEQPQAEMGPEREIPSS